MNEVENRNTNSFCLQLEETAIMIGLFLRGDFVLQNMQITFLMFFRCAKPYNSATWIGNLTRQALFGTSLFDHD